MSKNSERNQEICRLYSSGSENMRQLALKFDLSKARVHQILSEYGINAKSEANRRYSVLVSQIRDLVRKKPEITSRQIAEALSVQMPVVLFLIKKYQIERDKFLINSRAMTERRRRGRVELTRDLLYQKRIIEKKSQNQIARELGYSQQTISIKLRQLGIVPKKNAQK